jgi:outer membrane protein OmpA-like peptidoglycan-associated protein
LAIIETTKITQFGVMLALLLAARVFAAEPEVAAPVVPASPPARPAAPTPPRPIAFTSAVDAAGAALFDAARAQLGDEARELVIDPLIDASTGQQTVGSVQMGEQLARIVGSSHPMWRVQPLSRITLAKSPLLLIGTLTAIQTQASAELPADAFRVWLTLVDLRTGRIVAKQLAAATADSVNAEPTRYFQDSPTWHKDKTVAAYINSCQAKSKVGDPIDPAYLMRLPAAALVQEAITSYTERKLAEAHRLYQDAARLADPDDLRVLNGLYLTSWRLNKKKEAGDAFGRIVDAGLRAKQLPLKLLFSPGSTALLPVADLQAQYRLWLRQVATQAGTGNACLQVVGHASRTGSAAANEALSQRRAESIERSIEARSRQGASRFSALGVGSRENLIGLGTDDLRDALDRRVEFRVVECR